ncbi:MAG TPA: ankyrin repeat domain-containing protein [Chthonomonadaceae bacterium]|nr:ankyrin repeat domain-containing protein [Chthonomonadaceae bacterium]
MSRKRLLLSSAALLICTFATVWIGCFSADRQERQNRALISAIKRNDTGRVLALLRNGAEPNARDDTVSTTVWALLWARLSGKPVRFASGPSALDVLFESAIVLEHPDQPWRIQRFTIRKEPVAIVRALVAKGANVRGNIADMRGWPLVLIPAQYGWADSVQIMLDKGADINARGVNGVTVLSFAVTSRNAELVKLLISCGVNVNARDAQGKSVLTEAYMISTPEIVEMLKRAGATR